MKDINYNHSHEMKNHFGLSGVEKGYTLTVGDIRDAIARLPDDTEVTFGTSMNGEELDFYRFKMRGDDLLQIELQ